MSEKKKAWDFILQILSLLAVLTILETVIDKSFFTYYYSDQPEPFYSQFIINLVFNFIILSLALGYGFTKNWLKNEKMKQALKQEKLSAELNFLKTQLNPPFSF